MNMNIIYENRSFYVKNNQKSKDYQRLFKTYFMMIVIRNALLFCYVVDCAAHKRMTCIYHLCMCAYNSHSSLVGLEE